MPIQITNRPYTGQVIGRNNDAKLFRYVRLGKGLSFTNVDSKIDCKLIEVCNRTVKLELNYNSPLLEVNVGRKGDSAKTSPTYEVLEQDDDLGKAIINVATNTYFEMPGLGVFRFEQKGKELVVFHINPDKGTNVESI